MISPLACNGLLHCPSYHVLCICYAQTAGMASTRFMHQVYGHFSAVKVFDYSYTIRNIFWFTNMFRKPVTLDSKVKPSPTLFDSIFGIFRHSTTHYFSPRITSRAQRHERRRPHDSTESPTCAPSHQNNRGKMKSSFPERNT